MNVNTSTIGQRLQQIRQSLNETQRQFAARFDITGSMVSRYEKHGQVPNEKLLLWLANNGYSLDWLFTGEGQMMRGIPASFAYAQASNDILIELVKTLTEAAQKRGVL